MIQYVTELVQWLGNNFPHILTSLNILRETKLNESNAYICMQVVCVLCKSGGKLKTKILSENH